MLLQLLRFVNIKRDVTFFSVDNHVYELFSIFYITAHLCLLNSVVLLY